MYEGRKHFKSQQKSSSCLIEPCVSGDQDVVVCLTVLLHVDVAHPVLVLLERGDHGGAESSPASVNDDTATSHFISPNRPQALPKTLILFQMFFRMSLI